MTSTYTEDNHPWRPCDDRLRRRLDADAATRQLAGNSIDALALTAVYAGRDWEHARGSLFAGRAFVTRQNDPANRARSMRVRRHWQQVQRDEQEVRKRQQEQEGGYQGEDQQQEQQQQHASREGSLDPGVSFLEQQQRDFHGGVHQPAHTQMPAFRRSPPRGGGGAAGFEYANVNELDFLTQQEQYQQQQQHQYQQQQQTESVPPGMMGVVPLGLQHGDEAAGAGAGAGGGGGAGAGVASSSSYNYTQEAEAGMHDASIADNRQESQLAREFGLHSHNAKRDLRRARQCRYGLQTGGFRAPEPLCASPEDYAARYPINPCYLPPQTAHPLAVSEGHRGDFVRTGSAHASWSASRRRELEERQEVRRTQGKGAALKAALDELAYLDRQMLVEIPWYYADHKNGQSIYLGGGRGAVAQADFYEKNCSNRYSVE